MMPRGPTHQKPTAAPSLPDLQPLPLDPVRLVHAPEFSRHTLVQPVHAPEFQPHGPAHPMRALEFLPRTPVQPVRAPEFLRRGLVRPPLDPVAPVHAAERTRRRGADL